MIADSHDLQVFGSSEFFNIYNETDNIKNNPQDENAFFIHIVNSKTAPVFHKTFDWGTGEFENENGEKWSSPYGIGIIYKTSDEKGEWEDIPVPAGTQAVKYDMSDEDIVIYKYTGKLLADCSGKKSCCNGRVNTT